MEGRRIWTGLLGLLLAGPALAVFKCTGGDGRVTYTDVPCAADSRGQAVDGAHPLSQREEAAARRRGERLLEDARALDARRNAEVAERQRRWEAERQAELAQSREQAREDVEHSTVVYPAPLYARPWPQPRPLQPKLKPVQKERPAKVNAYPFH